MNADAIRDPSAGQGEEESGTCHALRRSALGVRVGAPSEPEQKRLSDQEQGQDPAYGREQDVQDEQT